ncbi:hypothetical protein EVAR_92487_1 [Eumeta japonica]|uniref:Uncharacterized protein n=1 Tax=Eumeta variegata TaxID=151549 RepID=A0A4C1T6Z3_EUMVA|nr:hypothetical protein EVAR_92487_1 [Eumeta japonica]
MYRAARGLADERLGLPTNKNISGSPWRRGRSAGRGRGPGVGVRLGPCFIALSYLNLLLNENTLAAVDATRSGSARRRPGSEFYDEYLSNVEVELMETPSARAAAVALCGGTRLWMGDATIHGLHARPSADTELCYREAWDSSPVRWSRAGRGPLTAVVTNVMTTLA